jgi:MoxR-like ATPase
MNPEDVNEVPKDPIQDNIPAENNMSNQNSESVLSDSNGMWDQNKLDLTLVADTAKKLRAELAKVIVGQEEMVNLMLSAILVGGHVLIEGVPGIAKTLSAKLMATAFNSEFSRIQFTPDLMPTDVVGTNIFNVKTSEFEFKSGPIFSNLILIDEINRAPAKTQAALFEVMEEYQVTIDGVTYPMSYPFFVIATQNPVEQEGTYKLPEAQLDRFLYKINIEYPTLDQEKEILRRFRNDFRLDKKHKVEKIISPELLKQCQDLIEKVTIKDSLLDYIAEVVVSTRRSGDLFLGASPRASLALLKASKALAAIENRDFVTPDDIQYAAYPVLNHRIILTPEREMEGVDPKTLINEMIKKVEVPR